MNPYLSIIVPVFNGEKHVERCLNSILNQTFVDFEIIVVNDGSTDNTLSILKKIAQNDNRIKIIDIENGGQSNARNIALRMCKGTVVGFVDADDWIHEDMYKILIENIVESNAEISECQYTLVEGYEKTHKKTENIKYVKEKNLSYDLIASGLKNRISSYPVWNKVYKKKLIENIYFYKKSYSEDYLFNFEAYLTANKIIVSEFIGYYYYQRSDSTIGLKFNIDDLNHLETSKIVYEYSKELKNLELISVSYERIIRLYFNFLVKKYFYGSASDINRSINDYLIKEYRENIKILLRSKNMRINRKLLAIIIYIRTYFK